MEEVSHGILVMTLDPVKSYATRMRMILWSGWIGMPIIFTLVLLMEYEVGASTDLLMVMAVILYSVAVLDYFVMDHILGKYIRPVFVYSDGLQFAVSKLDKIAKRNQFLSKEEIENFSWSNVWRSGQVRSFDTLTKKGKKYQIGPRNEAQVQAALDYFGREWRIMVNQIPAQTRKG